MLVKKNRFPTKTIIPLITREKELQPPLFHVADVIDEDHIKSIALAVVSGDISDSEGKKSVREHHRNKAEVRTKEQVREVSGKVKALFYELKECKIREKDVKKILKEVSRFVTTVLEKANEEQKNRIPWTLSMKAYIAFALVLIAISVLNGTSIVYGYLLNSLSLEGNIGTAIGISASMLLVPTGALAGVVHHDDNHNEKFLGRYALFSFFGLIIALAVLMVTFSKMTGNESAEEIDLFSIGMSNGRPAVEGAPISGISAFDGDDLPEEEKGVMKKFTNAIYGFFGEWNIGGVRLLSNLLTDLFAVILLEISIHKIAISRGVIRKEVIEPNPIYAKEMKNLSHIRKERARLEKDLNTAKTIERELVDYCRKNAVITEEKAMSVYLKMLISARTFLSYGLS